MKLLVIDDHPLVREGLVSLFKLENEGSIIFEANDKNTGLASIKNEKPDIVLVDLRLGLDSGFHLIEEAKELKGLKTRFIILTSSARSEDFIKAKELGASGYILKEAMPEELVHGVNVVSNGRKYYDPGVLELLLEEESCELDELNQLTNKELEVLRAIGMGYSNREISSHLFITENTVKKHVSQILDKLDLPDRTRAALYANAKGIACYILPDRSLA